FFKAKDLLFLADVCLKNVCFETEFFNRRRNFVELLEVARDQHNSRTGLCQSFGHCFAKTFAGTCYQRCSPAQFAGVHFSVLSQDETKRMQKIFGTNKQKGMA